MTDEGGSDFYEVNIPERSPRGQGIDPKEARKMDHFKLQKSFTDLNNSLTYINQRFVSLEARVKALE